MENNYYQIYVDSVKQLATSIVIKSNDTALALNKNLLVTYGPNAVSSNMATWQYYLNISGNYHYANTVMTIISLDTLETIDFTKDNLRTHTGTAKAYSYGSRSYKELLNRYPEQERLILGILYPVDIQVAINAKEGTILSYPPMLIEDNEYSLIQKLQEWIDGYLLRWNNQQFMLSDNLYAATMYGIMFLNMVPAILNIRLAACKTNEVHSYHIRQYLASNGMLDSYVTYLNRKQMLFLYRNIAYIMRNSGKRAVFEWLTEHIMTQRGLPLADFQMRHDLTDQPSELRPILNFKKRPLNTSYNVDQRNVFTVPEIIDKEDTLARDNLKYHAETQSNVISTMQNSLSNKLQTKLLETTVIDYSGSERYTLTDTLLYHWMLLSNAGYYQTYVGIEQPLTGEIISLKANNAFELYIYAFCKSIGITLTHLPALICKRVMQIPKPSIANVMSVVNPNIVSEEFAQKMLDLLPLPQRHLATDGFYSWCKELHAGSMQQYYAVCNEQTSNARGQKHALMSRCWSDTQIQLGTVGQTYEQWFNSLNLDIESYNRSNLLALCAEILKKSTGLDSSSVLTLKEIQSAMIRLMGQLGSYSVQYSADINDNAIIDASCASIRPDDFLFGMSLEDKIIFNVRTLSTHIKQKTKSNIDLSHNTLKLDALVKREQTESFKITPKISLDSRGVVYTSHQQFRTSIIYDLPTNLNNPRGIVPVLGLDSFLNLSLEQQISIPEIWH